MGTRNDVVVRSKARTRGATSIETLLVLAVAVLGATGFTALGDGVGEAIAGDTPASQATTADARTIGAALRVGPAAQAGLFGAARTAVDVARNTVREVKRVAGVADEASGFLERARYTAVELPESGVKLHVHVPAGAKKPKGGFAPVMVLPGLAGPARFYRSIPQELLDAGFAVVLFDIPNPLEMRLAKRVEYANAAVDLLAKDFGRQFDMSRLSLVGHSFGGATALALSSFHPLLRDSKIVAFAPGVPPSLDEVFTALSEGRMPLENALLEEALHADHGQRLVVGSEFDRIVHKDRYAKPFAGACTDAGHCTYTEISNAGHNNYVDVPLPRVPLWSPTVENPLRVRMLDLNSLSPRARTGASQRREASSIALDFLRDLLPAG